MENYTAYVLDNASREALLAKFPPKYSKLVAHHITVQFGVPPGTEPPPDARLNVVGYVDSKDGLEVLIVSVNGTTAREDGSMYHITWSLDPEKYSPKDSNALVKSKRFTIMRSIPILTKPELL